MNKPKSTTIELHAMIIDAIDFVSCGHATRLNVEGEYKVWREGGKVFLEVFHNG